MTATHNIKINGRWYHPGEKIPEPEGRQAIRQDVKPEAPKEPEIPAVIPEEPPKEETPVAEKAETRQRTVPRRKVSK